MSSDAYKGTANVIIDGQIVQSFSVSSAGTIPLTFTYNGTGPKDVTAQIVDSVLYDSSSEAASIDFSAATPGPTLDSAEINGANTKFTWHDGNGVVTIFKGSTSLCSSAGSTCQVSAVLAPLGTSVFAKDSAGNTSSSMTVTN